MSEESSEFDRWWDSQRYTSPDFDRDDMRHAFESGLETAEQAAAEAEQDDDASEPAKVIIVTEHSGRKRRFAASRFAMTDTGALAIGDTGAEHRIVNPVAALAPGQWADVAHEGAELDDETARALAATRGALGFAMSALSRICNLTAGDTDEHQAAADAIGELFDRGFE